MTEHRILYLFPPNYQAINDAFNIRGKRVIFAYGDAIYNPSRMEVPPALVEHEKVHLRRQAGNPKEWWDRYIADSAFRLAEEIPAYRVEFLETCRNLDDERALVAVASKLSSRLYGSMVDFETAKRLIRDGQEGTAG